MADEPISAKDVKSKTDASRIIYYHQDNWSNFFAGLNGTKDKSKYTEYGTLTLIQDEELGNIYMGDGLGGRIIDIVADDMTREWVSLEGAGATKLEAEFVRLDAEEKINEALKWQRLYGGSLLVMGIMDGQTPDKKLNPNRIRSIEYLKVFDKTAIMLGESTFDTDLNSPTFGQVLVYKIQYSVGQEQKTQMVHASRCIPFFNDPIPTYMKSHVDYAARYWGMSSLQRIYEDLRDLGGVTQSTVNILYEFIVGKYKLTHLSEMLAEGQERLLVERMQIMEMSKSILNAILLDQDEEYTRDYATVAGLPEVIDRFMLKLSGSTSIPVTRLFGRSPAGLNATGENDLRNYYDLIEANQRNRLMPQIRRLANILCKFLGVQVPKITFNSLYQLDEKEKAEVTKLEAETAKIEAETEKVYVDIDVTNAEELRIKKGLQSPNPVAAGNPGEPKVPAVKKPVRVAQGKK